MGSEEAVQVVEVQKEEDDDKEEFLQPMAPRKPRVPTQREIDEHYPLHLKFADWCPDCAMGAGRVRQHRSGQEKDDMDIPTISMDYAFKLGNDDEDESLLPCLVMAEHKESGLWVFPTDSKGDWALAVGCARDATEEAGFAGCKLAVKSDQEESILAFNGALAVARKSETCPGETPVGASKCNGKVERVIQTWQSKVRVLRCFLERKMGGGL